jgi:hypothetical protein
MSIVPESVAEHHGFVQLNIRVIVLIIAFLHL